MRGAAIAPLLAALLLAGHGCTLVPHGNGGVSSGGAEPLGSDWSRREWRSSLARDHALVGRIYDVATAQAVSLDELGRRVASADVVLLGEQHDNVDHHLLQAQILKGYVASGRRPAVAFEQIDRARQGEVDRCLGQPMPAEAQAVRDRANALAAAVEWDKSGWPAFEQYLPVFEVALGTSLPIRAANLSREELWSSLRSAPGIHASGDDPTGAWSRDLLSAEAVASLAEEIRESHCGYAEDDMVAMMTAAQKRRDQAMATAVLDGLALTGRAGAVLICGFGHARSDYGVPVYLRAQAPELHVVTVAFMEVVADGTDSPEEYASHLFASRLPFDYVVFTPRSSNEDPCEKFRAGLEKMGAR